MPRSRFSCRFIWSKLSYVSFHSVKYSLVSPILQNNNKHTLGKRRAAAQRQQQRVPARRGAAACKMCWHVRGTNPAALDPKAAAELPHLSALLEACTTRAGHAATGAVRLPCRSAAGNPSAAAGPAPARRLALTLPPSSGRKRGHRRRFLQPCWARLTARAEQPVRHLSARRLRISGAAGRR